MRFFIATILLIAGLLVFVSRGVAQPAFEKNPGARLAAYRSQLQLLRKRNPQRKNLPDNRFFLFGMGNRRKLILEDGVLRDPFTKQILHRWKCREVMIVPSDYLVQIITTDNRTMQIREDEDAVWLVAPEGRPKAIDGTVLKLSLPSFDQNPYSSVLKVLHHEVLINVLHGKPLPNYFVYRKPWYRDAAYMAMVLKSTGNIAQISGWINSLRDPFDRNNKGHSEPDNLGQVLYLVSLVSNQEHPVVKMVLDSVKMFNRSSGDSLYIEGSTDYALHPVYQTKWIKFGLRSLGIADPYTIPSLYDSYSSLFWIDYKDHHVKGVAFDSLSAARYPYLTWAEDHFSSEQKGFVGNLDYPLSWEEMASEADYAGMNIIDKGLSAGKLSYPHTWHASEMFLLLMKSKSSTN